MPSCSSDATPLVALCVRGQVCRRKAGALERAAATRPSPLELSLLELVNPAAHPVGHSPCQKGESSHDRKGSVIIVHDHKVLHVHAFEELIGTLQREALPHSNRIEVGAALQILGGHLPILLQQLLQILAVNHSNHDPPGIHDREPRERIPAQGILDAAPPTIQSDFNGLILGHHVLHHDSRWELISLPGVWEVRGRLNVNQRVIKAVVDKVAHQHCKDGCKADWEDHDWVAGDLDHHHSCKERDATTPTEEGGGADQSRDPGVEKAIGRVQSKLRCPQHTSSSK
mmetsp:Transcript_29213/g.67793  ORF Transcript_29213/g.67793 Transcript_29213/m.67793 type:complete len:285 (-) Transcript_29213:396-1250(-)